MPLPPITCPNCRVSASLDIFLTDDSAREALDAIIAAHPAGDNLIKPLLRYIGLFSPAKSRMAFGRMATLIGEISPAMRAAQISRGGTVWPAPMDYWRQAFETVVNQAHAGGISLPLKSHGYLLEVIARLSASAAGRKEAATEQQRAGHAGHGTAPERSAAPVTVSEPIRQAMPTEIRAQLTSMLGIKPKE